MDLHIGGLTTLHYLLAYAGMLLHFLMKLAEVFNHPAFSMRYFIKANIIPLIISIIGIPVLLIVATDSAIKDILPINYVTAVLAGWQTQSVFKTLFAFYGNKKMKAISSEGSTIHSLPNDIKTDNSDHVG